jgi:hypothetical protein
VWARSATPSAHRGHQSPGLSAGASIPHLCRSPLLSSAAPPARGASFLIGYVRRTTLILVGYVEFPVHSTLRMPNLACQAEADRTGGSTGPGVGRKAPVASSRRRKQFRGNHDEETRTRTVSRGKRASRKLGRGQFLMLHELSELDRPPAGLPHVAAPPGGRCALIQALLPFAVPARRCCTVADSPC